MDLKGKKIGVALTGSYCCFDKVFPVIKRMAEMGADIVPIVSQNVCSTDTKYGSAAEFMQELRDITGKEPICTFNGAEPIGPQNLLDVIVVAPCTGNTLAKIANAVTDTPVAMAVKSQLRNQKPVVIALSTNDGLGLNAKNIGLLLNTKHVYFVPFGQDNPFSKPNSLVAKFDLIPDTLDLALEGKQIQPLIVC